MPAPETTLEQSAARENWSSNRAFLLAAVGSAVGIGNIWRFPYLVGENGGSAFVLVYLLAVAAVAMPILTAELLMGRRGGRSADQTMRVLARAEGRSELWRYHGFLMISIALLGSSFFSVVSGWCVAYVPLALFGSFAGTDAEGSSRLLQSLTGDPVRMVAWHGIFMGATVAIVAGGVNRGLERALKVLMPTLFVLLVFLVLYAAVIGDLEAGLRFLFAPDFSRIDADAVLKALGQACLSLSVGVGVMVTYGAYLPRSISIPRATVIIAAADTITALLAGIAIFPIVAAYGLAPDEGPGLTFVTLPIAFGQMPFGSFVGTLFFILLVVAALGSSIGILETLVFWLSGRIASPKWVLAVGVGVATWVLGIASALSFNLWADFKPLARFAPFRDATIFGVVEYLAANLMLPVSVLLVAVFAGWVMGRGSTLDELVRGETPGYRRWRFLIRYVAPAAVLAILVANFV
jgi:NSS family neurotransmitter:Na+ symporter